MTVKTHFDVADDVWYFGIDGVLYRGVVSRVTVLLTISGISFRYSCIAFGKFDIAFSGNENEIYHSEEEALKEGIDRLLH